MKESTEGVGVGCVEGGGREEILNRARGWRGVWEGVASNAGEEEGLETNTVCTVPG
jgi:hypothetical protein